MGCDGGTIPKRNEVVKNKRTTSQAKDEETKKNEFWKKWKCCAISDWPMGKPIVAGHYGHLMDKKEVIEFLIRKSKDLMESYHQQNDKADEGSTVFNSLHSLKDIKELKLKEIEYTSQEKVSNEENLYKPDFQCPITGDEMNGINKFYFSWNCGCVVSERSLKEVQNNKKCLVCQTDYEEYDLVMINPPTEKDLETNQAKMLCRKMKHKMAKGGSRMPKRLSDTSSSSSKESPSKSGWANEIGDLKWGDPVPGSKRVHPEPRRGEPVSSPGRADRREWSRRYRSPLPSRPRRRSPQWGDRPSEYRSRSPRRSPQWGDRPSEYRSRSPRRSPQWGDRPSEYRSRSPRRSPQWGDPPPQSRSRSPRPSTSRSKF